MGPVSSAHMRVGAQILNPTASRAAAPKHFHFPLSSNLRLVIISELLKFLSTWFAGMMGQGKGHVEEEEEGAEYSLSAPELPPEIPQDVHEVSDED